MKPFYVTGYYTKTPEAVTIVVLILPAVVLTAKDSYLKQVANEKPEGNIFLTIFLILGIVLLFVPAVILSAIFAVKDKLLNSRRKKETNAFFDIGLSDAGDDENDKVSSTPSVNLTESLVDSSSDHGNQEERPSCDEEEENSSKERDSFEFKNEVELEEPHQIPEDIDPADFCSDLESHENDESEDAAQHNFPLNVELASNSDTTSSRSRPKYFDAANTEVLRRANLTELGGFYLTAIFASVYGLGFCLGALLIATMNLSAVSQMTGQQIVASFTLATSEPIARRATHHNRKFDVLLLPIYLIVDIFATTILIRVPLFSPDYSKAILVQEFFSVLKNTGLIGWMLSKVVLPVPLRVEGDAGYRMVWVKLKSDPFEDKESFENMTLRSLLDSH